MAYLFVGLGGVIGSILRFLVSKLPFTPIKHFPFWTLMINLLGAFIIGWFTAKILPNKRISHKIKVGISTGVLGGFTTFSTLSLDSVQLLNEQRYLMLLLYITFSLTGGLGLTTCGYIIGQENKNEVNQS